MYSLRTSARPFTPQALRKLPDGDRPVFWLRPPTSGDVHDAQACAEIEDEAPVDQSAFCSSCGKTVTVSVQVNLPGRMDQGKVVHGILARVINRVDHFGFDGNPAPWPESLPDRVAYVRRFSAGWVAEMVVAAKEDTELDQEEEREDSGSELSS